MATVFEKAKVRLLFNDPFYATILMRMNVTETTHLGGEPLWLAATNGVTLWINPENFEQLTVAQGVFVLTHECEHVALLHPFRVGGRNPKKFNVAADYVINDMADHEGRELVPGVLHKPALYNRNMSVEEVYNLLPDGPGGEGEGGAPGTGGNPLDGDVMPAPDTSDEALAEAVKNVVTAAHVAKAAGKLPSWVEGYIGGLLDSRTPWEDELLDFMTEVSAADYSFARPNRRFISQNLYLPGRYGHDAMGHLVTVIDTSGSADEAMIRRFLSEVVGAVEATTPTKLSVVYCDAAVQHVDEFAHPTQGEVADSAKRHGGGGTHMPAALDWVDENAPDAKAVIVFTDGYTAFGPERSYPVLWAICTDKVATMGRTIRVEV